MLRKSFFKLRPNELECTFCVGTKGNARADLPKCMSSFVDLDVDVRMLEETDGECQAAYTSTYNSNVKLLGATTGTSGFVGHASHGFYW